MKEEDYKISGFSFSDVGEYNDAKRESETIEYLKANSDLTDGNNVLKLYHKLVERKTLNTIVGYRFLMQLQELIVNQGIVGEGNLPAIPIMVKQKQTNDLTAAPDANTELKYKKLADEYRIRHRNSRIINVFLIVIIAAMLIINIWSNGNIFP